MIVISAFSGHQATFTLYSSSFILHLTWSTFELFDLLHLNGFSGKAPDKFNNWKWSNESIQMISLCDGGDRDRQ